MIQPFIARVSSYGVLSNILKSVFGSKCLTYYTFDQRKVDLIILDEGETTTTLSKAIVVQQVSFTEHPPHHS